MGLNPFALLSAVRSLDRHFELDTKDGRLIEAQAVQIQALRDDAAQLRAHVQAREDILVAEAKGVAGSGASMIASQYVANVARCLGAIEDRGRGIIPARLCDDSCLLVMARLDRALKEAIDGALAVYERHEKALGRS